MEGQEAKDAVNKPPDSELVSESEDERERERGKVPSKDAPQWESGYCCRRRYKRGEYNIPSNTSSEVFHA